MRAVVEPLQLVAEEKLNFMSVLSQSIILMVDYQK